MGFLSYTIEIMGEIYCEYCCRQVGRGWISVTYFDDSNARSYPSACTKHGLPTKANLIRKHCLIKWGLPKDVAHMIYKLL